MTLPLMQRMENRPPAASILASTVAPAESGALSHRAVVMQPSTAP